MNNLKIITSTTRPGRKGPLVANWIHTVAHQQQPDFAVSIVDLGKINLPLLDEVEDPKKGHYTTRHAQQWSEIIRDADAFIFVLAEYNHGYPAPIKNALDYLFLEWHYKPVGIVSYGELSGGVRATEALKGTLSYLNLIALSEAVHIPFFSKYITEDQEFIPDEHVSSSAIKMLQSLLRWTKAFTPMREVQP